MADRLNATQCNEPHVEIRIPRTEIGIYTRGDLSVVSRMRHILFFTMPWLGASDIAIIIFHETPHARARLTMTVAVTVMVGNGNSVQSRVQSGSQKLGAARRIHTLDSQLSSIRDKVQARCTPGAEPARVRRAYRNPTAVSIPLGRRTPEEDAQSGKIHFLRCNATRHDEDRTVRDETR